MMSPKVQRVIVLGGGSAGFMAALALKVKLPDLVVKVIRSKDIGIIGVGEGSTVGLMYFLHQYLGIGPKKFHEVAQPTWKLGLKFIWGPRPEFYYTFGTQQLAHKFEQLSRPSGFYCEEDASYDLYCALMQKDKAFARSPQGTPIFENTFSYHFENEKFVNFLEGYAAAQGVIIVDDTVDRVDQTDQGISSLQLRSGKSEWADLYIDASGFASVLLSKTLGEPFISFRSSLMCERAVVGGWARTDEPIKPYTTCETMNSGWCWQIEHENRINRGYVYCPDFISDEEAEREFRAMAPKVGPTRIVKFVSGCYQRNWVKNVIAIGNASGFVEPLEATALGVIGVQARLVADILMDTGCSPTPTQVEQYNRFHIGHWNSIRDFISIHYKFNTRLDTPFWKYCQEKTDIAGAEPIVRYYQENGPSGLWAPTLVSPHDQFGLGGYYALLVGQKVPHRRSFTPPEREMAIWKSWNQRARETAATALDIRETLALIRSPRWNWVGGN